MPRRRGGDHERRQQHERRRRGNHPLPRAKNRRDNLGRLGLVLLETLDVGHDDRLLGDRPQEGARLGIAVQQVGNLGLLVRAELPVQVPQQKFVLFLTQCHFLK